MSEIIKQAPHAVCLENREKLSVSGVEDVLNFDESGVVLKTVMGVLSIEGSGLRIVNLNVESKEIDIEGTVNGMLYQGSQAVRGGFFKRRQ
ncbi:MAG: sporulation protein YabP [Clostridia bacterium]|nr:sporulation protein YabP [Clostridia bacterium]